MYILKEILAILLPISLIFFFVGLYITCITIIGSIVTALVTALSFKQLGIVSRLFFWGCWFFCICCIYIYAPPIGEERVLTVGFLILVALTSIFIPVLLILNIPIYKRLSNTKLSKYVAFCIANTCCSIPSLIINEIINEDTDNYFYFFELPTYQTILYLFIIGIFMCMVMNLWYKSFNFYSKKIVKDSYFKPIIKWPICITFIVIVFLAIIVDVALDISLFTFGIIILLTILNFKIDSTLPTMQSNKT